MDLNIVRPTKTDSWSVNWVEAQTDEGNVIILPGHTPLIVVLTQAQELSFELTDGTKQTTSVPSGILTVTRTDVTVLVTHDNH